MSEFAPNISGPGGGSGTANGGTVSGAAHAPSFEGSLTHNVETQTAIQKAEIVFESTPETLHPINEPISLEKYRDEKVASGLLKDAGTYGFKGALERLATGETGQEPVTEGEEVAASDEVSIEQKDKVDSAEKKVEAGKSDEAQVEKPDREKPAKSEASKIKEETPEEKTAKEIIRLEEQLKLANEENRILRQQQERTEIQLKQALEQLTKATGNIDALKEDVEKLKKEIEELKKKRMGLLDILSIIALALFGEVASTLETEATEQAKAA